MSLLCTICARGGSKGVVGKNARDLLGKPVLAWSIEQARETGLFDAIAFSSDSDALLEAALKAGADIAVRRPDEMATDTAPKLPAIRHCLEQAIAQTGRTPEVFVDLDVTSPLRLASDITGAVDLLRQSGAPNVITGAPARRSPYFNLVEQRTDGSVGLSKSADPPITRRQDAPRCFDMNASIYVWRVASFLERPAVFYPDTRLFEMPEERSIDIDSDLDFALVELLLRQRMQA
ncbi:MULTISPECIES: acylneuraminate cytidylyltransferase family protein [Bradyrhizobium]|jgi:N-acylneuraminate cytidylyltransferase/CMP-N,N'-diacetyllegionaminic acid synthase|uniref:Posttranslational modification protein n=3 Tax=Bradyrhizobium TaxID=374 RepID=H7C812_BRADU|nr:MULTISPECIES: acylneuraminate cytidylyltransferase family protein [Bradyrhizobium]AAM12366.1 posttranslational modification protein [Bradyrhizobium japonicum]AND91134.1 flagellar modification protein B [Bradyrhizobium diazoefficiens USDA 110]MBP1091216.1 N-acylneuraminate cytidylyltransferase/CMP-N,N'-diacetyllegionaminic acid synthase [Bradyrhizobium japonicum]QBP24759.1 acylneuraminate cytidylyltransferase family protein [Bradyrhizobium diazoefficiens]QHP69025.1 acylneuraminate cytidylylt